MLMRDLVIRNKELKKLLAELAAQAKAVIDDQEFCSRTLEQILKNGDPKERPHIPRPYRAAPHYEILPNSMFDELKPGQMNPCGMEYLRHMQKVLDNYNRGIDMPSEHELEEAACGFPAKSVFFNSNHVEQGYPGFVKLNEINREISYKYFGGTSVALSAFYAPGGFIPWHNNGNAPGFNILMHYSWGGNGTFKTYHEGEIISYPDKDCEWVARAGRFLRTARHDRESTRPDDRDYFQPTPKAGPETASWHCAETSDWRYTLSTIINYEEIWRDLIDEIETE